VRRCVSCIVSFLRRSFVSRRDRYIRGRKPHAELFNHIIMGGFGRRRRASDDTAVEPTEPTALPAHALSKQQIKRATQTRKTWALTTSFFLFITVIFLILVNISGVRNKAVIKNWYFIRLDLSNIVPASVPNFALINTIAQTLGLHDFYQVGLWGYCEGYAGQGVTFCSEPQTLYWFNPVEILRNQLLAGASSKSTRPDFSSIFHGTPVLIHAH